MVKKVSRKPAWVRAIERCSEFSGILGGLGILFSAIVIVQQVAVRYILKQPAIWQIELSIYLLLMTTFVGGAYGLKHGGHVGVDVIVIRLPGRVRTFLELFTSLVGIVFCMIMAWLGWQMWYKAYIFDWHSESLWGPSLVIPYLMLPLGMTFMALQYIVQIRDLIMELTGKKMVEEPGEVEVSMEESQNKDGTKETGIAGRLGQWITSVWG